MAWLIIQAIDVINDPLKLPEWLDRVVIVLLAVGFLVFDQFLFSSREPSSPDTQRVRRFAIDLPWQNMTNWGDFRVRISPQGTHLASPGSDENRTTINLRPLDRLEEPVIDLSHSLGQDRNQA